MLENTEYLRERSKISGDPVADVLTFANARLARPGTLIAGGSWALRFPAPEQVKFNAVLKGRCWLKFENETEPRLISAGDVFIMPSEQSYVLAGELDAAPVEALPIFDAAIENRAIIGDGQDFMAVGGHLELDAIGGWNLAEMLPPLLHIDADSSEAQAIRWLLEQLIGEALADRPGAVLASAHLVQLLFVQALRYYLTTAEPIPTGWLGALADEQIAPALSRARIQLAA